MKKLVILLPVMMLVLAGCSPQEQEAPLEQVEVNGQPGMKVDGDSELLDEVREEDKIVDEDEVVVEEDAIIMQNGTNN